MFTNFNIIPNLGFYSNKIFCLPLFIWYVSLYKGQLLIFCQLQLHIFAPSIQILYPYHHHAMPKIAWVWIAEKQLFDETPQIPSHKAITDSLQTLIHTYNLSVLIKAYWNSVVPATYILHPKWYMFYFSPQIWRLNNCSLAEWCIIIINNCNAVVDKRPQG